MATLVDHCGFRTDGVMKRIAALITLSFCCTVAVTSYAQQPTAHKRTARKRARAADPCRAFVRARDTFDLLLATYELKRSDESLLVQLGYSVKAKTEDVAKQKKMLAQYMSTDRATVVKNEVERVDKMSKWIPPEYLIESIEDTKKKAASRAGREFDQAIVSLKASIEYTEDKLSSIQAEIGDAEQEIARLDLEIEKIRVQLTSARRAELAAVAQLEPCARQVFRDARLRLALQLLRSMY